MAASLEMYSEFKFALPNGENWQKMAFAKLLFQALILMQFTELVNCIQKLR